MAEVIREVHHDEAPASGGNNGLIIGLVIVLIVLIALFVFGRGYFNNKSNDSGTNVKVEGTLNTPGGSTSGSGSGSGY
jgi:hypothetical protein